MERRADGLRRRVEFRRPNSAPRRRARRFVTARLADTTLSGETSRYSLSGTWNAGLGPGRAHASAYVIDYGLELFSNFTYLLDDPIDATSSSR